MTLIKRIAKIGLSIGIIVWTNSHAFGNERAETRQAILGEALLNDGGYALLESLSDRFGPRMIGTPGHRDAMEALETELRNLGLKTKRQRFRYPGWVRGDSTARILHPLNRVLRVAELGYAHGTQRKEGNIVYVDSSKIADLDGTDLNGSILLLKPNVKFNQKDSHALRERGVRGALLINRVNGGQLLARVANHDGEEPPFPMLSITQEEGMWMQRLIEDGETVRVRIETGSKKAEFEGANLIATLPGATQEKVVLGGHFDSWDLGQGSIDNGLGVAQIFEAARLLKTKSPRNSYTIEFVWFDAEEFGLWGSRHYASKMNRQEVRVMVNLDMVGTPIAVNAMGFDSLVPVLEKFSETLGSWSFQKPVANKTWLGSDHHPFILQGVPAITFNAPVDHDSVRYYHDFADTFDKVDRAVLARASAVVSLLLFDLANDPSAIYPRLTPDESEALFRKANLEDKMKQAGLWPFPEN